jgi:hypothetical protein
MFNTESFIFNCALLNWATNHTKEIKSSNYLASVRAQKFLFFYNLFAHVNEKPHTFVKLKAFINGPVYYDIYAYCKTRIPGISLYVDHITHHGDFSTIIDNNIAIISYNLVNSMTVDQLSSLTHTFEFWKNSHSVSGQDITIDNLSSNDEKFAKWLYQFWNNLIENYFCFKSNSNYFYINNADFDSIQVDSDKATELQSILSEKLDYNPVVLKLDEEGDFIID